MASMAAPEGATLVQDVDSDKEGDVEYDDGVSIIAINMYAIEVYWPFKASIFVALLLACRQQTNVHCGIQGALQRAVAENPSLIQDDPAFIRLANKVSRTTLAAEQPVACVCCCTLYLTIFRVLCMHNEGVCTELRSDAGQGC